jgi:hypothetical protein
LLKPPLHISNSFFSLFFFFAFLSIDFPHPTETLSSTDGSLSSNSSCYHEYNASSNLAALRSAVLSAIATSTPVKDANAETRDERLPPLPIPP